MTSMCRDLPPAMSSFNFARCILFFNMQLGLCGCSPAGDFSLFSFAFFQRGLDMSRRQVFSGKVGVHGRKGPSCEDVEITEAEPDL